VLVALDRAAEALADVATGEAPCSVRERDLALLVASSAADGDRVARLLAVEPEVPPAGAARSAVFVFAATAPIPPDLPAWAEAAPDDPDGMFAWALLETRRGRGVVALPVFARAFAAKPELAANRDPVDVARLQAVRDAIRAGDLARGHEQLDQVTTPRLEREATSLRAMLLIRTAAGREQTRLGAATLGPVVRSLLATLPQGGRDHRAVAQFAREADELRARWLLLHDRADDARPIVGRLGDGSGPSQSGPQPFLAAVLAVLEGQPIDAIERDLTAAGDAHMAAVLLAEVRGARGDVAARVDMLEKLRAKGGASENIVDEALVQAYQSARRGLDAKRVALEEVRRHGKLGPVLATQLREALALEAPAPIARDHAAAAGLSLPVATVADRARMLADLAARRHAANPAAIDAGLASFERAVQAGDRVAAAAAERAVLVACGGPR
jgi:hypothetical protein